jgi:toxin FitB
MKVVDSSGWLEYLADGPNADFFAEPLSDPAGLVVPVVTVYEVFKRMLVQRGETAALEAVALMQQGQVVELDAPTALVAARLSIDHALPMADAMILATAVAHDATLWTQDQHFERLDGVRYVGKGGG